MVEMTNLSDLGKQQREELRAAYSDLLIAAQLQEAAETQHANCEECEGRGVPELCHVCFPFFDDARVKRRLAIAKATRS
jgi:hypothetical protein